MYPHVSNDVASNTIEAQRVNYESCSQVTANLGVCPSDSLFSLLSLCFDRGAPMGPGGGNS